MACPPAVRSAAPPTILCKARNNGLRSRVVICLGLRPCGTAPLPPTQGGYPFAMPPRLRTPEGISSSTTPLGTPRELPSGRLAQADPGSRCCWLPFGYLSAISFARRRSPNPWPLASLHRLLCTSFRGGLLCSGCSPVFFVKPQSRSKLCPPGHL